MLRSNKSNQARRNGGQNNSNQSKGKRAGSESKALTGKAAVASAYSTAKRSNRPENIYSKSKKGGFNRRIRHSEFIANVNGATTFTAIKYNINPGLESTFPWLSTQADSWEQYCFKYLAFEYVTRSGSTEVGSVILAPDYDASDPPPLSEAQVTAYEGAVEDVPWRDQLCVLDIDAMHALGPRKYVRSAAVPGDIKTFDAGTFFVCSVGQGDTDPIGKLWVHYDVEFFIPQKNDPLTPQLPLICSMFTHEAAQNFTNNTAQKLNFDIAEFDPLGIGVTSGGRFTPPAGCYRVDAHWSAADTTAEAFGVNALVLKNDTDLGSTYRAKSNQQPSTVSPVSDMSLSFLVVVNGTDTVSIQLTMTGVAGVLSVLAEAAQILWMLA